MKITKSINNGQLISIDKYIDNIKEEIILNIFSNLSSIMKIILHIIIIFHY